MSKADVEYKKLVKKIIEHGEYDNDGNVRTVYADGESAYTKSLFGVQVKFDGSEVPILTSKKVFFETAKKEMMLFWINQTVKKEDFKEANVKVWNEWFNENGNLGRSYAYQFESHRHHIREVVKVKQKIKEHYGKLKPIVVGELEEPNYDCNDYYIGKKFNTTRSGEFIVLNMYDKNEQKYALIQFINTGSKREIKRYRLTVGGSIKEIKDYFERDLCDVGYLGNYHSVKNYKEHEIKKLLTMWQSMIRRCYSENDYKYNLHYSGKGIFVDERWHSFENFLRDIRYIPHFFFAKENNFNGFELDKDYFKSNCYSKDTCVWLEKRENNFYTSKCSPFRIINEELNVNEILLTTTEAKNKYGLDTGDCSRYLNGKSKVKRVKGFHLEYINDDEFLYRYELSKNQVVELLRNIKQNPYSRRLETNFWNFADADKKVLQECAFSTQFNIRNNKLDLLLRQRSADIGLGVVFNQIQYYVLQCMVAHVFNLKVGTFTHQIGNLHYYDRHEQPLKEQLEAEEYDAPKLWINPNVKDFFDFTHEDIKLINYKCGDYIPMEVAI